MNIVWLTPEIPYPPYGGRNGVFHRIVEISKYHTIYLFSIAYSYEEQNTEYEMKPYCKEVHYYNRNESKLKKLLKSVVLPYSVASRTLHAIVDDIQKLDSIISIDAIIVDFPNMALNLKKISKQCKFVTLNQHNIEYQRMRDMVKITTIPLYKRIAYYIESLRLECYEKWLYGKKMFASITFFSEDDMELFKKRWKKCKSELEVFPLGADEMKCSLDTQNHSLLFVGRLDEVAVTNVEAVIWFVSEVLPLIITVVPDIKFIVAGANPSERIMNLASDNIIVIPNYNKLQDVYSQSGCVVLPLLSGGGVKGKLLEAAALKRIIVTTSHGIEGTRFQNEKHVFLANDPVGFANACIKAVIDPSSCNDMVNASYDLFEEYYNWKSIGKKYNEYLIKNAGNLVKK